MTSEAKALTTWKRREQPWRSPPTPKAKPSQHPRRKKTAVRHLTAAKVACNYEYLPSSVKSLFTRPS